MNKQPKIEKPDNQKPLKRKVTLFEFRLSTVKKKKDCTVINFNSSFKDNPCRQRL